MKNGDFSSRERFGGEILEDLGILREGICGNEK